MVWDWKNPQGNEAAKIIWELPPYTRGKVLDIGCGQHKTFRHFTGVDNLHHREFGININPDIVAEADNLSVFGSQSWDAVFSSHLLEHIVDYKKALKEWWRVIRPGGHLVLYLPHADFYPRIGTNEHANGDHKHDFLPQDIIDAMKEIGTWDLVENQERNEDDEYSFFQVYKKLTFGKSRESWKNPKPEKTACVMRMGAFGDNLMASSVCYGLKKQGYHVTYMGQPPGIDVLTHDPNIDRFIVLDKDQVPNALLGPFWAVWERKFDKWVNLSETVEGAWLALPGRSNHEWPYEIRKKHLNYNYLQFQHELAGVPHDPHVTFYATDEEKSWARKERSRMGGPVIQWSLSGSSVHKHWPYLDQIIARVMIAFPSAHVVLTGGPECVLLEAGWEKEPRVHRKCSMWDIRQSLAFLEQADLVIGPETGVLNAASGMSVPKIVFLSHSTEENLTRDWVNCTSLSSDVKCYPCHRLHWGWKHCWKDEEAGAAMCQSKTDPERVWNVILETFRKKEAA